MKDKFDKNELKDTMTELQNYIMKITYDFECGNIKDIEMLDKVLEYLEELEGYYE